MIGEILVPVIKNYVKNIFHDMLSFGTNFESKVINKGDN